MNDVPLLNVTQEDRMIRHYYAVVERGEGRTMELSFPGRDRPRQ
jgi:hypothetical protein